MEAFSTRFVVDKALSNHRKNCDIRPSRIDTDRLAGDMVKLVVKELNLNLVNPITLTSGQEGPVSGG